MIMNDNVNPTDEVLYWTNQFQCLLDAMGVKVHRTKRSIKPFCLYDEHEKVFGTSVSNASEIFSSQDIKRICLFEVLKIAMSDTSHHVTMPEYENLNDFCCFLEQYAQGTAEEQAFYNQNCDGIQRIKLFIHHLSDVDLSLIALPPKERRKADKDISC